MLVAVSTGPALAAPGEDQHPVANPDLVAACGLDILVILDTSGSIAQTNSTNDVKTAFRAFTSALDNTGSRLAVVQFSTVASLPIGPGYTTVTDATIASTFNPFITAWQPSGSTNWEDGLRVARYFAARPSQQTPHLVVFITDGDPNRVVNASQVTYAPGSNNATRDEYELKVPLDSTETTSATTAQADSLAIPNANAMKAQGSHMLVIGVGSALSSQASLGRIEDISGPDVFSGTGTFDISTDDVYREPDFSKLQDALRDAAFQLCAPSVNVRKLVDVNADPNAQSLQPGVGWSMTATASPTPSAWVLPAGAAGSSATATTGFDGFATFQWRLAADADSTVSVSEAPQAGYANDPSATTCTYRTPDQPVDQPLPNFTATAGGFTGTVPRQSIVTCQMINRLQPAPSVQLVKSTNGADANAPPGPLVPVGSQVTWTYAVTNTGNVPLTGIAVTDDQVGVTPDCPATTLAPGQTTTCTATGIAQVGPYANVGTVTATGAGAQVTASDPSHYDGIAEGIDIEKQTNGEDADDPPGPYIPVGDAVTWTYVVTNTGTAPLAGVAVTDDRLGPITCPVTVLATGGSMTCTATATAGPGQYENVATVTATGPLGPVGDSDASHYFGTAPSVSIEKYTITDPADTPPGPTLGVGTPFRWNYVVTNTGNTPLDDWEPIDNGVPGIACPRIFEIQPGESKNCFAPGVAQAGEHEDIGTVSAVNPLNPGSPPVTASDPAHYFGEQGDIELVKSTNGDDANAAPGPFIPVGQPVIWTYLVTNTGNSTLSNVQVVDLRSAAVNCPQTTLPASESMECTATGTAVAGQYFNLALVDGTTPLGDTVRAVDPSHYFGAIPGIRLEKLTNGLDANDPPGPYVPVGDPVQWSYIVTNSGNVALTGIAVTDSAGVAVTCPDTRLAAGDAMTCTASGTAAAGQYANVGTVTANGGLTASDPSHYFGAVPHIAIKTYTDGFDADDDPGPAIPVGDPVTWTYLVTNPGNVPFRYVGVTDDRGVVPVYVSGDTNGDSLLDPGETWLYRATGVAGPGVYENHGIVDGLDVFETPRADSDPSHYHSPAAPPPPTPTPPPPPPPPSPVPIPIAPTSTVRVVKIWVRARSTTTIFADRDGKAPWDASAKADTSGTAVRLAVKTATQVSVGELAVPKGYTATIDCGAGRHPYHGGPVPVTSPSTDGAIRTCTIVNTAPVPPPRLVLTKRATRRTVLPNGTVDFVVTVANRGRGPAHRVTVCDRPPTGLVFVGSSRAHLVRGAACWHIAVLAPGKSRSYTVHVRATDAAPHSVLTNVATATSSGACASRARAAGMRPAATCRATARAAVSVLPAETPRAVTG